MHLHRVFKGLDDTAMETAFIGVSAVVAILFFSYALNSQLVQQLARVPFVGPFVTGAQTAVGQIAHR